MLYDSQWKSLRGNLRTSWRELESQINHREYPSSLVSEIVKQYTNFTLSKSPTLIQHLEMNSYTLGLKLHFLVLYTSYSLQKWKVCKFYFDKSMQFSLICFSALSQDVISRLEAPTRTSSWVEFFCYCVFVAWVGSVNIFYLFTFQSAIKCHI